jgi:PAS domain S-box-containing protein
MNNHSYQNYLQDNTIFQVLIEESVSPVGLYIGREMIIKLANKAILNVWGKDESVIGKAFSEALPELNGQPFYALLDKVYTTGVAYEAYGERADLLINGQMQSFYFNFTFQPLKNNKGEVWGVLNTASDVTELVLTRMKLAESEERSRFALESAQLGAWDLDPIKKTITCDVRCKRLHGFLTDKMPTYQDMLKHIHPADRKVIDKKAEEALKPETGGFFDCEFRVTSPEDKSLKWLRSKGKAYFDENGNCIRFAGTTVDITAEILNKDEKQKLITLIDHTSDFVSLSDIKGNVTYVNAAGRQMMGLDNDNYARPSADYIMPGESGRLKTSIKKTLHKDGGWSGEVMYRHLKTGEPIPVFANTMFIYDQAGKPQGHATIARDLRSEIASKQALIDSENLLQNITSASPTTLWMTDDTGMITYINQTWMEWTGQPLEQTLGTGWLECLLPEDRERAEKKFLNNLNKRLPSEIDFRIRHKDGGIRWCIATGNPQHNLEGKFTGYVGACMDVTETIKIDTELQLKNAELNDQIRRFEFVTDFMPVQLWTAKPSGEIDYVNKQFLDFFGFSLQEFIDYNWLEIVHPDDREGCIIRWTQSLNTKEPYQYEFRLKDKNDNYKWHLARALPFMSDGNIVKWFGTNTDIDEQKQMQRQKDDFLGVASHELKTPVTSIKAYAQVLGAMLSRDGEEKKAEMVMKMDSQLNRLTNLIGDLLDVTKINSGRIMFNKTWFDFNKVVQENIIDLQHTTNRHILVMDFKDVGKIYSDKDRIGQVITNLITNAVKYSPSSNRIIISTEKENEEVTVCVQDFGIGIADDKKDRVFEQFYRVSGNKQHTFPGLGLGLYISNEIIRREGGKMWVNSVEGKGSTFCFSLPVNNDINRYKII